MSVFWCVKMAAGPDTLIDLDYLLYHRHVTADYFTAGFCCLRPQTGISHLQTATSRARSDVMKERQAATFKLYFY